MIGKIPFKPKKGFVLPKHRFSGPYKPLHLQIYSKYNLLPGNEPYNAVDAISISSAIDIMIRSLENVDVIVKCLPN